MQRNGNNAVAGTTPPLHEGGNFCGEGERKMSCDAFEKRDLTKNDETCWNCIKYFAENCPYGKFATQDDRDAIEQDDKERAAQGK